MYHISLHGALYNDIRGLMGSITVLDISKLATNFDSRGSSSSRDALLNYSRRGDTGSPMDSIFYTG